MKQDWYRQTTWNAEIESMFFTKLSRARKWNAPQYLRIQAGLLLYASSDYFPSALMLTNKLFDEYPYANLDVMFAHCDLADYYLKHGLYDKAREHYEIVNTYNNNHPNAKYNDSICEMGIAEIIIKQRKKDEYEYARRLLAEREKYYHIPFPFLTGEIKKWESLVEQLEALQQS